MNLPAKSAWAIWTSSRWHCIPPLGTQGRLTFYIALTIYLLTAFFLCGGIPPLLHLVFRSKTLCTWVSYMGGITTHFHEEFEVNWSQGEKMAIFFTQPIRKDAEWLNLAPPPLRLRPPRPMGLKLWTHNIQEGCGFRPPQEVWAVEWGNYNLILLTETKIPDAVYWHNRLRYKNICSKETVTTDMGSHGRFRMVSQERPEGWVFDSTCFHGPNVVSWRIVAGD